MRCVFFAVVLVALHAAGQDSIPTLDLNDDADVFTVVDREAGQYLGHPSSVLLADGRTVLCVYPKGHGRGAIVYRRSSDGGRTWSERLPTPDSWDTSREVPTMHRVTDAAGVERLIMWSGLYPARLAVSEDNGQTWGELEPAGDWGGIVVMGDVVALDPDVPHSGRYLALFHDDGRFFTNANQRADPPTFTVYKTLSTDGGLTWSAPEAVWSGGDVHLCEPGVVRSPDGSQLAVLLRENRRVAPSHIVFSDDEGATWSDPRPMPRTLMGDRHQLVYADDGRLVASFRDMDPRSPTQGDWLVWVGTYDDLANGTPGRYRVRLKDNHNRWDSTYPTMHRLPDGTILCITYGHWAEGEEPYILAAHLDLDALDARVAAQPQP